MAAVERALVEESTVPMVSGADPTRPCVRSALFLRPRADGAPLPALPRDPDSDPGPVLGRGIQAEFRGWAGVPRRWREWVDKLRPRHEPLWREVGILDAVLASTCRVQRRRHERALLQLAAFWSGGTGTFVFPWGEATVTLEDVAALAGLPLVGCPVRAPVSDELEKEVGAIEAVRTVLIRSEKKKALYSAWVKHFVERTPEKAASSGSGEARDLVEHGAFLSMWLSLFVLPAAPFDVIRREVLPLAARLARGESVALAPAALASIYRDLSALKRHLSSGKTKEPFVISAPMHVLQLWVWERFPQLRPEMASRPAPDDRSVPRAARWQDLAKRFSPKYIRAVFMSPKEFDWRPYGSSSFTLQAETGGCWVHGQDIARSIALLSFARCLHACELVGMNCIDQYNPHRVARQLGFDQDVPGTLPRAISDWEEAWNTYSIEGESSAFIVPDHKPGVTFQYAQWWERYSSACATAVANAAKMKERHDCVSPMKRKIEGIPATNSGKKLHVDTATQEQPPHQLMGVNLCPSQSSGGQAARRRAAAAPGLILHACPPDLRFRAVSTTAATGIPQPTPDGAKDLLDDIPLAKRLNSISMMRKRHILECLVKSSEQEQIVGSAKSFIPRLETVGAKKAVSHKNIELALFDAVENSAIIPDESSCGSVTRKEQAKCLQQIKEDDRNIANEENNSRTEYGGIQLLNVVHGAVGTGSNEAFGAGTEVNMPTLEDILISDDDECDKSSCEEHEVSALHLKSHTLGTKTSPVREGKKDIQLVGTRNDKQDNQVLKEVTMQGNHGNTVVIGDDVDEPDEETRKEDATDTMHPKYPKMVATGSILQEPSEEKQLLSERNDQQDNLVLTEVMVQNSHNCELASVQNDITLRQAPDVLIHAATLQTHVGLSGPTEEKMHTCIVGPEIDNTDKVQKELVGSLDYNENDNEDILVATKEIESPIEDFAGANRKRSGNSERSSSRLLDGNTKLVSSEVCTKTLFYLSRFDRVKDAWDKDANSTGADQDVYLPRWAVGTMEMVEKASAIRQAEIAELKKKIDNLNEEILALEAAERGEPLEY